MEPVNHKNHPHPVLSWISILMSLIVVVIFIWQYYVPTSVKPSSKSMTKASHSSTAIPVVATSIKKKDVPIYISALGTVTPTNTVTVKSQLNGQLLQVFFQEGQIVQKGDLLAEIDPRPYQAQLTQFEGQLARDRALLANAEIDLQRYQKLYSQNSTSQQTLDTQVALVQQYEGTIKNDVGQIEGIQLNLLYSKITSPICGKIGLRLVDPGNFVQLTDPQGLFVINTMQPITVVFSVAADNLAKILQKTANGEKLKTEAYDRMQQKLLDTGELLALDNQLDPTTGTIKIKAQFKNEHNQLFPNQFVNIKLLVDTLHQAMVVPTAAIQHGVKGPFVYLISPDHTARITLILINATYENETVITGKIKPDQQVVLEGTDKLTDGTKITTVTELEPKKHKKTKLLHN